MLFPQKVAAIAQDLVPEPDDYRMDHYRGPVPQTLAGGVVVSTETAHALWFTNSVAFIDVLPRAPKPPNLPEGTIWRENPRHSIPGAIWLPNVGYGAIAEVVADYFRAGLKAAVGDDKSAPILFFCLEECWMSWNAVKRAYAYGYRSLYSYRDGTDGWGDAGHPLVESDPVPLEPSSTQ